MASLQGTNFIFHYSLPQFHILLTLTKNVILVSIPMSLHKLFCLPEKESISGKMWQLGVNTYTLADYSEFLDVNPYNELYILQSAT